MSVITGIKQGKTETTLELLSGIRQEPINMQRRILMGGALAALFSSSGRVLAEENHGGPDNPFILLLKGIYQSVAADEAPANNLGLTTVMLNDGSYSKTRIYPIFGILESNDQDRPIGKFYFGGPNGNLCAYDLPGGAIAMKFNDPPAGVPPELGFNNFSSLSFPDGQGGSYLEGTFELVILEATGIYQAFQGGHNHMVDRLHQLPNNAGLDEFCFCNISQYQFP
jgi:hypothetical protein